MIGGGCKIWEVRWVGEQCQGQFKQPVAGDACGLGSGNVVEERRSSGSGICVESDPPGHQVAGSTAP